MKAIKRPLRTMQKGMKQVSCAPVTETTLSVYFEDMKDLIRSTDTGLKTALKVTETTIRKDMDEKFKMTWTAITEHSKMIKGLQTDVKGLDAKIDGVRTELKVEMHQMEHRLSEKIDGHVARLDDHEARIVSIESAA